MKVITFLELLLDISNIENLNIQAEINPLIKEANEITAIIVASLKTTRINKS